MCIYKIMLNFRILLYFFGLSCVWVPDLSILKLNERNLKQLVQSF